MNDRSERGLAKVALSAFRGIGIEAAGDLDIDFPDQNASHDPKINYRRKHVLSRVELQLTEPPIISDRSASMGISALPRFIAEEEAEQKALLGAGLQPREKILEAYFRSKMFSDALVERNLLASQGKAGEVDLSFAGRLFEDLAFRDLAGNVSGLYPGSILLSPERSDKLTRKLIPVTSRKTHGFGRKSFQRVKAYTPDGFIVGPDGIMAVVEYSMSRDPDKFKSQCEAFQGMKEAAPSTLGNTNFMVVLPAETHLDLDGGVKIHNSSIRRDDVGRNLYLAVVGGQKAVVDRLTESQPEKQAVNKAVRAALDGNPTEEDLVQIFLNLDSYARPISANGKVSADLFVMPRHS